MKEMLRTFNMGIGMVLIIKNDKETLKEVQEGLSAAGEEALLLGSVVAHNNTSEEQVQILNLRANVLE